MITLTSFKFIVGKTVERELTQEEKENILKKADKIAWLPWEFDGVKFTDGTGLMLHATDEDTLQGSEVTPPEPWYVEMFLIEQGEI